MVSVLLRAGGVLGAFIIVGVLLWAPWKSTDRVSALMDADGNPIADTSGFRPVPGSDNTAPHELIRYQMPEAATTPPLAEGATAMVWEDLWEDGALTFNTAEDQRVGRPDFSMFPAGTTAEDVMLFYLDLGDMRSLQPQIGSIDKSLDGKRVRLAGYTTPVGFGENERRFLLVPELGACIHVPPPPPNQIVYVPEASGPLEMFAPVWVTGTLRANPVSTILADVGYQLVDAVTEPYR
ncbi:MAG: DUF3299 domain-containing protein [Pseudomonadota bacterium]